MIVLIDVPNPAGGNRALAMMPSDTFSGFELYRVLYFPDLGETLDTVGEDHVKFLSAGWAPNILHAAVEEMTRWADMDATGEPATLKAFVARMDAFIATATARLPAYSQGT